MIQLYHEEFGAGRPIVLVHGVLSDHTYFDKLIHYLDPFFHIITYDRRGYGKNAGQCNDYSLDHQVEDLFRILHTTADSPAWLLGYSAGGTIALKLAVKHPELLKGIILFETAVGLEEDDRKALAAWNNEINDLKSKGKIFQVFQAFEKLKGHIREDKNGRRPEKGFGRDGLKTLISNLNTFVNGELNDIQMAGMSQEELAAISVPVLMGISEKGRNSIFAVSSLHDAKRMGWPVVNFPGTHDAVVEYPGQFAEKLMQ